VSKLEILSPDGVGASTAAARTASVQLAPRLPGLAGRQVALHDNAKPGSGELLSAIGRGLEASGAGLRRWSKAHAARPSPHVADMAPAVDAAVFALGD
jgi:hypothetical protein